MSALLLLAFTQAGLPHLTLLTSGLCCYGIMIGVWCLNIQGRRQKTGNAHSCQMYQCRKTCNVVMHQLLPDMLCGDASLVARHALW